MDEEEYGWVTLEEANEHVALLPTSEATEAWAEAGTVSPPAQQIAALVTAAHRIGQVALRGQKSSEDQEFVFPREGIEDEDGNALADDVAPAKAKRAQINLALAMLVEDLVADTGLEPFEEVEVGPLRVRMRAGTASGKLPGNVIRDLRPFMKGSPLQFGIERA